MNTEISCNNFISDKAISKVGFWTGRYIAMGLATLFAVPVFEKHGIQKWVRYAFLAHSFTTPLIAYVYFYPNFSNKLLLLASPWLITAPLSMLMLSLMLKRMADAEK